MKKRVLLWLGLLILGTNVCNAASVSVTVDALVSNWTSTGVTITTGAAVTIEASGQWCGAPWSCYGPEGTGGIAPSIFLAPGLSSGGLVGKVGNNAPFLVGSTCSFNAQDHGTGILYLAFNDEITGYYNNSGTMDVTITTTETEEGDIELVGQYTAKPAYDLKVRGDYAYITGLATRQLNILNISDPTNPTLAGTYTSTAAEVREVALIGNYAYIACSWAGFEVIDISDPSSPTKVGPTHSGSGVAVAFEFANGYGFLANRESGIRVFDVSDPANPVYVTTYSTSTSNAWASSITISGNYLYIGIEHSPNGFEVFDISNPAVQNKVGTISGTNSVFGIAKDGDYVYHSGQWEHTFNIVDVSNPSNPVRLGTGFPTHGDPWGIAISGNVAFLGERAFGLQILDISDKANPTLLDEYNTGGDPLWGIAVVGDYVYLANGSGGLVVLRYSGQQQWTGEIAGYVMTYAFDHIAGAEVELYRSGNLIATQTVGVDAYYSFVGLPEGTYTLKTQAPGFEDGENTVTLTQSVSPLDEPIYLIIAPLEYQWSPPCDLNVTWEMGREISELLYVINHKTSIDDSYTCALSIRQEYPEVSIPGLRYTAFTVIEDGNTTYENYPIETGLIIPRAVQPHSLSTTEFTGCIQWQWIPRYNLLDFGTKFIGELVKDGTQAVILSITTPPGVSTAYTVSEILAAINSSPVVGEDVHEALQIELDREFDSQLESCIQTVLVPASKRYYLAKSVLYQNIGPQLTIGSVGAWPFGALTIVGVAITGTAFWVASHPVYLLAADPVDTLWDLSVELRIITAPPLLNQASGPARDMGFRAMEFLAFCRAMTTSYDKLLGAIDAESPRWIAIQGASYAEFLRRMESALGQIEMKLEDVAPELSPITADDIGLFKSNLLNQGPDDFVRDLMLEYGWDQNAIAEFRDLWVSSDLSYLIGTNDYSAGVRVARAILSSIIDSLPLLPIEHIVCNIDVVPDTVVLSDNSDYIQCYLEFENPELIQYVDNQSLALNDGIIPVQVASDMSDFDGDGIPDLELVFSASDVLPLLELGSNALSVSGFLVQNDTSYFGAIDLVEVITAPNSGSIAGVVTNDGIGVLGITVDLVDSLGSLIASAATDHNGYFGFDSLTAGDYTVTIITPMGFQADHENIPALVMPDIVTPSNFTLTALEIVPQQRSRAYWAHQLHKALQNKPKDYTLGDFSNFVGLINVHFNQNQVNPVDFYSVPQPADQSDSLTVLKKLLHMQNTGENEPLLKRLAKAQLMALMLNVVSGKVHQTHEISADGRTVSQLITYCDMLVNDEIDPPDNNGCPGHGSPWFRYIYASFMLVKANLGLTVPAGMIPEDVIQIAYKQHQEGNLPTEFALHQNYPNPFNPATDISFSLPTASQVKLEIFNIMGQKVATLVDGQLEAGAHIVPWDGNESASGVYFYRLQADDFVDTKKMILLK